MPRPIGEQIAAISPLVTDAPLAPSRRGPKSASIDTPPSTSDSVAGVTVEISLEAQETLNSTKPDGPRGSSVAQAVAAARTAARANGEKIGPAVSQAARLANGSLPPLPPAPVPAPEPEPTPEPAPISDSVVQPPVQEPSPDPAISATETTPLLSADIETFTTTHSVFTPLSLLA